MPDVYPSLLKHSHAEQPQCLETHGCNVCDITRRFLTFCVYHSLPSLSLTKIRKPKFGQKDIADMVLWWEQPIVVTGIG